MKLTVTEQEKARALKYAEALREAMTEGIAGAELMGSLQTLADWNRGNPGLEEALRRSGYAAMRALSGNFLTEELQYGANWAHLGGSFDTKVLCYLDANGLKHIEGVCARTGSAVNGEVIGYLPGWMIPEQDGKILLVATSANVGRVDIIGNQLLFRTTGGYTGGSAYLSFDPVPAYR